MNNILMIGVFIVVEILMNRLVSLIFRFMEKKHNSVHLRFTKSFVNVLISVILCYTLLHQIHRFFDICIIANLNLNKVSYIFNKIRIGNHR